MARSESQIQTDACRGRLGDFPTACHDVRIHDFFQQTWEHFIKRRSISDIRLHRTLVLAIFFQRSKRHKQLPHSKPVNCHEGLFPALDSTLIFRADQTRGFRHLRAYFNFAYVLLWLCAQNRKYFCDSSCPRNFFYGISRVGTYAGRHKCKVSRCALCSSVFYSDASFLNTRNLSGKHCRKIFLALGAQPNDWSDPKRPRFPSRRYASELDTYWHFFHRLRGVVNYRSLCVQKS